MFKKILFSVFNYMETSRNYLSKFPADLPDATFIVSYESNQSLYHLLIETNKDVLSLNAICMN